MTRDLVLDRHESLYGLRKIPLTWFCNDFDHKTCYYVKDTIPNRRFDKGRERIYGEFSHTTPDDEAASSRGRPVILVESHGCIHVKPKDIDDMTAKGYMKRGNLVVIHGYGDRAPLLKKCVPVTVPFEVHFFPGAKKILIKGNHIGGAP